MIRPFGFDEILFLLQSTGWTLVLTIVASLLGGVLGLCVALARVATNLAARELARAYIGIVQGIPVLMVLFLSYYGLSYAGLELPPIIAASISLAIYSSAYLGDIWRGAIQSVARQQWEASASLAMTRRQQYRYVILPQSVKIALPPTVGFLVQIIKMTSLASVIGFVELTRAGQIINNTIFQPFLIFSLVGLFYFALCYPLSRWSEAMENKLNVANR